MKVSREAAALNRERIVDVASRLFREKGFNGIGVADLMKEAGMTHGGFYGHFESKDGLAEEACRRAASRGAANWTRIADESGDKAFQALVKSYLSSERLASPGSGCLFVALGPDAARQGPSIRRTFQDGFNALVGILAKAMPGRGKTGSRRKSIAAFSEMVGAMMLARSVNDPELANEILGVAADDLVARFK